MQPVLSPLAADVSPEDGGSGIARSPQSERVVVVKPLSSTMLIIRSAVLLSCLIVVPALALVGVSWTNFLDGTSAVAQDSDLDPLPTGDRSRELDELQQLAGMTGTSSPSAQLQIPPETVPALWGDQAPPERPYWEQGNQSGHDVEAAVVQSPAAPQAVGLVGPNGAVPNSAVPNTVAPDAAMAYPPQAGDTVPDQQAAYDPMMQQFAASSQHAHTGLSAGHDPNPQATHHAQGYNSTHTQLAGGSPADPDPADQGGNIRRRPWAKRPPNDRLQGLPQQHVMMSEGSVPAGTSPSPPTDHGVLQAMIAELRERGAAYFRLETWGQVSYFRCEMPMPENARYHAYFEATHPDPVQAVREVLEKIEKWQAQQTGGPVLAAPPQQPGQGYHR